MTAVEIGRWHFTAAADNHNPVHREEITGTLIQYDRPDVRQTFTLPHAADLFRDAHRSLYLIDDSESVIPHYVAGWNDTEGHPNRGVIHLHPFPVNPGGRTLRADRPEPVDYRTWMLGPRRAYHLKITRIDT